MDFVTSRSGGKRKARATTLPPTFLKLEKVRSTLGSAVRSEPVNSCGRAKVGAGFSKAILTQDVSVNERRRGQHALWCVVKTLGEQAGVHLIKRRMVE